LTANTVGKRKAKKPELVYPARAFFVWLVFLLFSNERLGVQGIALPGKNNRRWLLHRTPDSYFRMVLIPH